MAHHDEDPKELPTLNAEMAARIRQVVDLFDRKKEAASIAGVIPEQLNRWCQAQSEPRFVGIARLAKSKGVSLDWIATGHGDGPTLNGIPESLRGLPDAARLDHDVLLAVVSGFLAAEGIDHAHRVAEDIVDVHNEMQQATKRTNGLAETSALLPRMISEILSRQKRRQTETSRTDNIARDT
jgi:DNA-binding phage protein